MKNRVISLAAAITLMLAVLTACSLRITKNYGYSTDSETYEIDNRLLTINNDLFSYQIGLDYVVYTLPCRLSEFLNNGWEINYAYNRETSAEVELKKGRSYISVAICNDSSEKLAYKDCMVYSVRLDSDNNGLSIVLPGGMQVNKNTTKDDIIDKYGEPKNNPSEVLESQYRTYSNVLYYCAGKSREFNSYGFAFGSSSDKLIDIYISHRGSLSIK